MTLRLANHYWSGKYSISIHVSTPLGRTPKHTIMHEVLDKKEYIVYLKHIAFIKDSLVIDKSDDGRNRIIQFKEKYTKQGF